MAEEEAESQGRKVTIPMSQSVTDGIQTWVLQHLQQCSSQDGEVTSSLLIAVEKRSTLGQYSPQETEGTFEWGNRAQFNDRIVFTGTSKAMETSKGGMTAGETPTLPLLSPVGLLTRQGRP